MEQGRARALGQRAGASGAGTEETGPHPPLTLPVTAPECRPPPAICLPPLQAPDLAARLLAPRAPFCPRTRGRSRVPSGHRRQHQLGAGSPGPRSPVPPLPVRMLATRQSHPGRRSQPLAALGRSQAVFASPGERSSSPHHVSP